MSASADAFFAAFGMKPSGFECRVPGCLGVTPNEVRRWHWSKTRRAVAKCRRDVGLVLSQFSKPELPVVVTMTRCSVGKLDDDGAVGAMKSCRDEIAKWLGVVDNDARVTWKVEQRKVKRAAVGTVIRIERCTAGAKVEPEKRPSRRGKRTQGESGRSQ